MARHTKSSPSIVEQHTRKLNAAKMKTFGRGSLGTVQDCGESCLFDIFRGHSISV